MLELDQVLRANELSISLVAAVPSLLVAGALLRALAGLLARRPPDAKREAVPCRCVGLLRGAIARRGLASIRAARAYASSSSTPARLAGNHPPCAHSVPTSSCTHAQPILIPCSSHVHPMLSPCSSHAQPMLNPHIICLPGWRW